MASNFFHVPDLGIVTLEDELLYFDGPVLFTVRAKNGGRYLVFWAWAAGQDSIYWFSPVSDSQYRQLLRGELDLRSAFTEQDIVLQVLRNNKTAEFTEKSWLAPESLRADALPQMGYRLEPDEDDFTASDAFAESAQDLAIKLSRPVARLEFDFGKNVFEGPAAAISTAILQIQKTLDAIAYSNVQKPHDRGSIPHNILSHTALSLRPIRAGSVGIELVAVEQIDMLNDSVAAKSLQVLLAILHAKSDQSQLKERFIPLAARAASAYRSLVRSLVKSGASSVRIDAGLPELELIAQLTRDELEAMAEAMDSVERLKSNEISITAVLVAYDSDTHKFKVRNVDNGDVFRGLVTGKAVEYTDHAEINKQYNIKLLERIQYDSVTDEPLAEYELIEIL